jgi:DNA-binding SARP family transcriptional activator/streptogramin lyase
MEFRILGPLEVIDEGRPVVLQRGKQLALLAYLLLHPNELVSADRLIDALWGERPPPTAAKILQNAVSQLRRALGEDRLVTQPPGYRFRLEQDELDLHRFEQLAQEGRMKRDAQVLRDALAIWRGEPLANLRDELFAQHAARQLEEARLSVLEDRIDADLAAGRDAVLVPELEQLIAAEPLRERAYGQLMLALYRDGRQADALETYQRARKMLSQEVGLEPSPQLQELERRMLNQDPALAPGRASMAIRSSLRHRRRFLLAGAALVGVAAVALGLVLTNGGAESPVVIPDSLVKIDPKTNKVVDVIPVGRLPVAVALAGDFVWVVNSGDSTLTRVDTRSGHAQTIGGLNAPTGIAADDNGNVWVTTAAYESVIRVNGKTLRPDLTVPLRHNAYVPAVGAGSLWVTEPPHNLGLPGTLARINLTTTKLEQFTVGIFPIAVAVGERAVWVTNAGDASISRISLSDGSVQRVPVGLPPGGIVTGFGSVWLTPGSTSNTIWRLNPETRQVDGIIDVGGSLAIGERAGYGQSPFGLTVGPDAVWATLPETGTVVRIDPRTNKVVKRIRLGFKPHGIVVGPDAVWVAVAKHHPDSPF